jgi:hypothetical protein
VAVNAKESKRQMAAEYETVIKMIQKHPIWPQTHVYSFKEYCWAKSVISTRAFHLATERNSSATGLHLVPFIDIANSTQEANVEVICDTNCHGGACIRLVSTRLILRGEQLYVCYDPRLSFTKIFERYGYLGSQKNK